MIQEVEIESPLCLHSRCRAAFNRTHARVVTRIFAAALIMVSLFFTPNPIGNRRFELPILFGIWNMPLSLAVAVEIFSDPVECTEYLPMDTIVCYNDVYLLKGCFLEGHSGTNAPPYTDFLLIQSGLKSGSPGARNVSFTEAVLWNVQVAFFGELSVQTPDIPVVISITKCTFVLENREWTTMFVFDATFGLPANSRIYIHGNEFVISARNDANSFTATDFTIGSWRNSASLSVTENSFSIETRYAGEIVSSITTAVSFFFSKDSSPDFNMTFDATSSISISKNDITLRTISGIEDSDEFIPLGCLILFFGQHVLLTDGAQFMIGHNSLTFVVDPSPRIVSSSFVELYVAANLTITRNSWLSMVNTSVRSVDNGGAGAFKMELMTLSISSGSGIRVHAFNGVSSFTDDFGDGSINEELRQSFGDCELSPFSMTTSNLTLSESSSIVVSGTNLTFDNTALAPSVHIGTIVTFLLFRGIRVFDISDGCKITVENNFMGSRGYSTGIPDSKLFFRGCVFVSHAALHLDRYSTLVTRNNQLTLDAVRDGKLPVNGTDVVYCSVYIREHDSVGVGIGSKIVVESNTLNTRSIGPKKTMAFVVGFTRTRLTCSGQDSGIFVLGNVLQLEATQTQSSGPYDPNRAQAAAVVQIFAFENSHVLLQEWTRVDVQDNFANVTCGLTWGSGFVAFDVQGGDYFNLTGRTSVNVERNTMLTLIGGRLQIVKYFELAQIAQFLSSRILSIQNNSWILIDGNLLSIGRIPHPMRDDTQQTPLAIHGVSVNGLREDASMDFCIEGMSRRRRRGGGSEEQIPHTILRNDSATLNDFEKPRFEGDDGASSFVFQRNNVTIDNRGIDVRSETSLVYISILSKLHYTPAVEVAFASDDEIAVRNLPFGLNLPPYSIPAPPSSLAPLRVFNNQITSFGTFLPLILLSSISEFAITPRSDEHSTLLGGGLAGRLGKITSTSDFLASQCENFQNDFQNGIVSTQSSLIASKIGKGSGCIGGTRSVSQSLIHTQSRPLNITETKTTTPSVSTTASASPSTSASPTSSATDEPTMSLSYTMSKSLQRGCPTHCDNVTSRIGAELSGTMHSTCGNSIIPYEEWHTRQTVSNSQQANEINQFRVSLLFIWAPRIAPIAITSSANTTEGRNATGATTRKRNYEFTLVSSSMLPGEVNVTFDVRFYDEESLFTNAPEIEVMIHFSCFESTPFAVSFTLGSPPPPIPVLQTGVAASSVAVSIANMGNAADMQTLAVLGLSACAKGATKSSGMALRAIAPLAFDDSCEGAVLGNFVLVVGAFAVHSMVVLAIRARCQHTGAQYDWMAICDDVKYPSLSLTIALFAQNGFFFCGVDLLRQAETAGTVALGAIAVAWTCIPIIAFCVISLRCASRAFTPLLYRTSGLVKLISTPLLPSGQLDATVRGSAMFSSVVSKFQHPNPFIVLVTFAPFVASIPLTIASNGYCTPLHLVLAIGIAVARPYRVPLINALQPLTLGISAAIILHYTLMLPAPFDIPSGLATSLNIFAALQTVANALKSFQALFAIIYSAAVDKFPVLRPFVSSHIWAVAARKKERHELREIISEQHPSQPLDASIPSSDPSGNWDDTFCMYSTSESLGRKWADRNSSSGAFGFSAFLGVPTVIRFGKMRKNDTTLDDFQKELLDGREMNDAATAPDNPDVDRNLKREFDGAERKSCQNTCIDIESEDPDAFLTEKVRTTPHHVAFPQPIPISNRKRSKRRFRQGKQKSRPFAKEHDTFQDTHATI